MVQWGAPLVVAAGVLLTVGFLTAWFAGDRQVTTIALSLIAGSLLLTLPFLVALPPYLLQRWERAAWFPSIVCSSLLVLIVIGFATMFRPGESSLQLRWYDWDTLIFSLKSFGALLTLLALISFWNRPQGVAATTIMTGVIAYHLGSALDGSYPEAWRLLVALVFAGSWVWMGLSVKGVWLEWRQ